jgi:hypothetical protein
MYYVDCNFYYPNPKNFEGCPGLDFQGDDEQCGNCPYRLKNFKRLLMQVISN